MKKEKRSIKDIFKYIFSIKMITINSLIAALYIVLTFVSYPLSYGLIQVRISELLNLLIFFNPCYSIGVTLGCLISNTLSTSGLLDIIFGTLATLVSSVLMIIYSRFIKNLFFSGLIPCLINAISVPFIIYFASIGTDGEFLMDSLTFFTYFGTVFLGEFISINIIGYIIFMLLSKKYKRFDETFNVTRNLDFKW